MGYTIVLRRRSDTTQRVIYDGTESYPTDKIKLTTGGNERGKLTFRMAKTHPYYGIINEFLSARSDSYFGTVCVYHDFDGKSQSKLFVGEIVETDYDVDGIVTVTCMDYLHMLDNIPFRLDECGYDGASMTLASLMPLVMTKYNNIKMGHLPSMSGCTVVESYGSNSERQEGRVTPDGTTTNPERMFPTSYHQYDAGMTRTFFDLLRDLAKSMGATVVLEHDVDNNTFEVVFHAATSDPNAHLYEYGKTVVDASVWYDASTYKNAAFATGGMRKEIAAGIATQTTILTLMQQSVLGSSTVKVRSRNNYVGSSEDIPGGSIVYIDGVWYETVENTTVYGGPNPTPVDLKITPYIQKVSQESEYVRVWTGSTHNTVEVQTTPSTPSGYVNVYRVADNRYIYNYSECNKYGIRAFEFTDSNAVYGQYLGELAIREISKRMALSRGIEASILAVEVTHDYGEHDSRSHTMIGDVVHIKHTAIGIDEDIRIDGMTINVDNPSQNKYSFGFGKPSVTRDLRDINKSVGQRIYENRKV